LRKGSASGVRPRNGFGRGYGFGFCHRLRRGHRFGFHDRPSYRFGVQHWPGFHDRLRLNDRLLLNYRLRQQLCVD
jgi:hypothetical protein